MWSTDQVELSYLLGCSFGCSDFDEAEERNNLHCLLEVFLRKAFTSKHKECQDLFSSKEKHLYAFHLRASFARVQNKSIVIAANLHSWCHLHSKMEFSTYFIGFECYPVFLKLVFHFIKIALPITTV